MFFAKINLKYQEFNTLWDQNKIKYLLRGGVPIAMEAAKHVRAWEKTRRTTHKNCTGQYFLFLFFDFTKNKILFHYSIVCSILMQLYDVYSLVMCKPLVAFFLTKSYHTYIVDLVQHALAILHFICETEREALPVWGRTVVMESR